ncbi:MAG: response regulator [Syntrophobacteraceae bacterium]|nr:response regulator [Syntrophobacteraceae bacterium]
MTLRILLVDDDEDLRTMLESILKADGYGVEAAGDLETAFKLMASGDYEIMLLDKNIPGINGNPEGGIDLLKHVRSLGLPSEVIMMTGAPTVETAIEAMKLGAFDYITKPFSLKDLRLKIRRLSQYRNFLNPEYTIGFYRRLQSKMLEVVERVSKMSDQGLDQALVSLNDEVDKLFALLRESERIILAEREALSHIATLSERLKAGLEKKDENYHLADKISRLSNQRV